MALFSFRKGEILRQKKLISRLFNEGSSFYIYPFRVFWLSIPLESPYPAQVMVSVGKKSFKHAVDRNRIKRQVRESYRLQKHELYHFLNDHQHQCAIGLLYTSNTKINSTEMDQKIKAVIKRLFLEINKKLNKPPLPLSH